MSPPSIPSNSHAAEENRRCWERKNSTLRSLFDGDLSPQAAAEQIADQSILPLRGDPGSPPYQGECDLSITWAAILEAARVEPTHHHQLSNLLFHLSRLPQPSFEDGQGMTYYGRRVWEDLPLFGMEVNEEINCFDPPPFESPKRPEVVRRFTNANAFFATSATKDVPAMQAAGMQGLWIMRAALEEPVIWPPMETTHLDADVPAAAAWIHNAGQAMLTWEFEYESGPLRGDPGRGGPLWSGQHGFCKERWALWKKRFYEVAEMDELPEDLRGVAKSAAEEMEEVEARA